VASNWQLFELPFIATNGLETLEFLTQSGEVWVDTVSIETSGDVFVQPEEPLDILDGESAMGEWRLEVRDARTGAVLPTGEILEWSLNLSMADVPNRATRVENGFIGTFELHTNDFHFIVLDPCRSATFARLIVTGLGNFDALEMRADWSGFPSGDPEKEDFAPIRNDRPSGSNGQIVFEVNRSLPAPATLRGKPLYLVIYNRFQNATNRYDIDFISDGDCTPLTPPPVIDPGNTNPTPGTLPPGPGGPTNSPTAGLFQFNVGVNIRSATVTVVSDQDVSVYALKDEPPTTSLFSHVMDSVGAGPGTEVLVISNSDGSALIPGTWFVRVVNDTTAPVNYTVSVRFELMTPPGQVTIEFIRLPGVTRLQLVGAQPGVNYEILASDSLLGPYTVIATVPGSNPVFDVDPSTTVTRFYRARPVP
jgi:hypothetical protein